MASSLTILTIDQLLLVGSSMVTTPLRYLPTPNSCEREPGQGDPLLARGKSISGEQHI